MMQSTDIGPAQLRADIQNTVVERQNGSTLMTTSLSFLALKSSRMKRPRQIDLRTTHGARLV